MQRNRMSRLFRIKLFAVACLIATVLVQVVPQKEARADFFQIWGQVHGGWVGGAGDDRFDDGSHGAFGGAVGVSILFIDVFTDIRVDGFDPDTAGMWNQLGAGVSFGIPLGIVELILGARVAYLYAQFSESARERYEEKLENGERLEEPPQKGMNFSAQVMGDIELIWPLYLNLTVDLGYHVLLPDPENSHGFNYTVLGGLKLKFGF